MPAAGPQATEGDHCYVQPTSVADAGWFGILGRVEVPPVTIDAPAHAPAGAVGLNPELSEEALASLCAAVAAETGIPQGRVRKVLQVAQRHQRAGGVTPAPPPTPDPGAAAPPGSRADRLRYYPLGANGRLRPPAPLAAAACSPGGAA